MAQFPLLLNKWKKSEKNVDSCHHIYSPTSICTHTELSLVLFRTSLSHPSSPTPGHYSTTLPFCHISHSPPVFINSCISSVILPSYKILLLTLLAPPFIPSFLSCGPFNVGGHQDSPVCPASICTFTPLKDSCLKSTCTSTSNFLLTQDSCMLLPMLCLF